MEQTEENLRKDMQRFAHRCSKQTMQKNKKQRKCKTGFRQFNKSNFKSERYKSNDFMQLTILHIGNNKFEINILRQK